MRYTVTFEIYVEADNDQHAVSKADMIANRQNEKYPAQTWDATELHRMPFGSLITSKVDMNKIRLSKYAEKEA